MDLGKKFNDKYGKTHQLFLGVMPREDHDVLYAIGVEVEKQKGRTLVDYLKEREVEGMFLRLMSTNWVIFKELLQKIDII